MKFDFEPPNNLPTMLVISSNETLVSDMQRVNPKPPQYDQRTIDDVAIVDGIEQLDKLDAFAAASKKLSKLGNDFANSSTYVNSLRYVQNQKNN